MRFRYFMDTHVAAVLAKFNNGLLVKYGAYMEMPSGTNQNTESFVIGSRHSSSRGFDRLYLCGFVVHGKFSNIMRGSAMPYSWARMHPTAEEHARPFPDFPLTNVIRLVVADSKGLFQEDLDGYLSGFHCRGTAYKGGSCVQIQQQVNSISCVCRRTSVNMSTFITHGWRLHNPYSP